MAGRATLVRGSRALRLAWLGCVTYALGCGGQSKSQGTDDGERGGGGSPGGTGASRGGNAGTAGSTGGTQISGIPPGGVYGSGGTATGGAATGGASTCDGEDLPAACVCGEMTARWIVQNLFVALDRSEAMAGVRWNRALETLMVLFGDDALSNSGVALSAFPDAAVPSKCNDATCSPEACGVPLVELARLTRDGPPQDMQEYALLDALSTLTPQGTAPPLSAALDGAIQQAENHVSEHPDERAHVVLIATGEENACSEASEALAARAFNEYGIRTYVLGFEDANLPLLDTIAVKGGTERTLLLGNDVEANAAELIGLTVLRPGDISCDFPLPPPENLDFTRVSVTMSTVNGETIRLHPAPAATACDDRGFYFDDPANPTSIALCPVSCADLKSGDYDVLEVSIGCAR